MSNFDEWFKITMYHKHLKDNLRDAFEAGAQSKQAEIDELQKKIDGALEKCYTGVRKQGGDYYLELVEDILKGNKDE